MNKLLVTLSIVIFSFSSNAVVSRGVCLNSNAFYLHQQPAKEQVYCSPYAQTKYKVLIRGNKIKITRLYKEYHKVITGILKKGKIYSNDPGETKNKSVSGRYYKLQDNSFGVLNIENGDYDWFEHCK